MSTLPADFELTSVEVLHMVPVDGIVFFVRTTESSAGVSVSCPALPGCWAQGATHDEALANIRDAIRENLRVRADNAATANLTQP